MINSMTAFARASANTVLGTVVVELRSVNHRYLDCHFKLPDELRALEPRLRERLGNALSRGKVDCLCKIQTNGNAAGGLKLNRDRLEQVLAACREIARAEDSVTAPDPLAVLQFPGVAQTSDLSPEAISEDVLAAFDDALTTLATTRAREGEQLAAMIRSRVANVIMETGTLRERLPEWLSQQGQRLRQRIADMSVDVDAQRLEQELVLLLQKADVDEELDRLDTHIGEVQRILNAGGPCGRRLDFLMQELNREANTLSAKSTATSQTQSAIELKVLIEQMREQIQNIE